MKPPAANCRATCFFGATIVSVLPAKSPRARRGSPDPAAGSTAGLQCARGTFDHCMQFAFPSRTRERRIDLLHPSRTRERRILPFVAHAPGSDRIRPCRGHRTTAGRKPRAASVGKTHILLAAPPTPGVAHHHPQSRRPLPSPSTGLARVSPNRFSSEWCAPRHRAKRQVPNPVHSE